MPLERMEHFLVISDDIEQTRRFYCDALGLRAGFRPELSFAGYWLYAGEAPCVHVAERRGYRAYTRERGLPVSAGGPGSGAVDHIAFNATDYAATRERLDRLGIEYSTNELDDVGIKQLFARDPSGVTIELNFRAST